MYYHLMALRAGGQRKTITNKSEDQILAEYVVPFLSTGTIKARWGNKSHLYQVLEIQVYGTREPFNKKDAVPFEQFIKNKKNQFSKFKERAESTVGIGTYRVFVVMPIQGEQYGSQNEQRIFREYDERFSTIETCLSEFNCVSIRIDKEHPLEDIVGAIKREIRRSHFVVADLTDERPSCYFEAGYAEALRKPVIYVASKESVGTPSLPTKIHFDVHMSVNFFTNHEELRHKLTASVNKNEERLFASPEETTSAILA